MAEKIWNSRTQEPETHGETRQGFRYVARRLRGRFRPSDNPTVLLCSRIVDGSPTNLSFVLFCMPLITWSVAAYTNRPGWETVMGI
jgi:hypothetical protein